MPLTTKRTGASRNVQVVFERLLDPFDLWKSGKNEWRSRCPLHRGDNPTTFQIRQNGQWRCYKCGAWGSIEDLVMRMHGLNYQQAKEYIGNAPSARVDLAELALPPWEDRFKKELEYPVLPEASIVLYRRYKPVYLERRGFSDRSLLAFEIGYDSARSKIVLPVRDVDHRLVGITLRLDFDVEGPKYWHDHFDKSRHLYGFHRWKDREIDELHLVEGQLDAVRMFQLGKPACAILGSSISDAQVELLRKHCRASKLVLSFDNDEAGEKATSTSMAKLIPRFGRILQIAEYPGKDPGDLTDPNQIVTHPWATRLL